MSNNDKPACRSFKKEITVLDNVIEKTLIGGAVMRIYKEVNYVCEQCDLRSPDVRVMRIHTSEGRVNTTQE